jgi:outer membrane protein OmpA-like peptidoglycan-associated protein
LLWEAREEILNDVQQKGPARLVIEGHAAQNETNPANRAETRATIVRNWFEGRRPIPNLQLLERGVGSRENKSMVRLIIERERAQTSR